MNKNNFLLVILFALFSGFQSPAATFYTYINGGSEGNWSDVQTWTTDPTGLSSIGSAVPGNGDFVYILNGYSVSLSSNVNSTGLNITINMGGTLDLKNFRFTNSIASLSGGGTLRIRSGYFPTITSNNFALNQSAVVEYIDFSGSIPQSINYPNLTFTNTASTNHTIVFSNTSSYSFTIERNLTLQRTGTGSLTVNLGSSANAINATVKQHTTVGSGTILGVTTPPPSTTVLHSITFEGNVTNNGTIRFSNNTQYAGNSNGAATVTFSGNTNNTLTCNGITDIHSLTLNKGSGSLYTLHVVSSHFNNFRLFGDKVLVNLINGTLRLGSNINLDRLRNGPENYNLGDPSVRPTLWIDGADVSTGGCALVVYGKFRITSGSFTAVSGPLKSDSEGAVIRIEGEYLIEGGVVTLEKFRPSTETGIHRGSFTMTGGEFNVSGTASNAGYARFSIPFPEQVFIMSGGTINVSNPQNGGGGANGGIHIGVKPSNFSVTGGTFNAILSGNASFFNISSTAPFYNLNISRTGGTPTIARIQGTGSVTDTDNGTYPLVVLNDLTLNGANSPTFNPGPYSVTVGGNFSINSGATYNPSFNNTIFNGTGNQIFKNDGTITTGINTLTINKATGSALTLSGSASSFLVTNTLNLLSGILNDGGKALNVYGSINNTAVHTGIGNITLNGASTQTLTGNGSGIFGNLILSNNSVPGAVMTCNQTISGTLTLAGTGNSLFDADIYLLSFTSPSATAVVSTGNAFGPSKMIRTSGRQSDAGVRKTFSNLLAFTYPVGTGSLYTPVELQINSTPTTFGNITVRPVNTRHEFVQAGNTNNLVFYWRVTSAGFSGLAPNGVSHTYQYMESSVSPALDDANYIPASYNPTSWSPINDVTGVDEVNNRIFFRNIGFIDGDYTAGIPSTFGIILTFYSKMSGLWNSPSSWSNVSHTGPNATGTPGANDQVYIGDGASYNHTITINSDNRSAGRLVINGGSTLDVTTTRGHNFGALPNTTVGGNGRLRISSNQAIAEFPAGDFGNFIRVNGGTVEYYTTSLNFTIPEKSASPTELPLITYKNLVILPGPGYQITLPNQDERIYGNLTIQGGNATGIARLNSISSKTLMVNGNLILSSGTLQYQNGLAQSVVVDGDLSIASGAAFNISSTGASVQNTLTLKNNLINNGTFDMHNGTLYCNVIFSGTQNTSITGTGATTDFNVLTVAKGSNYNPILNVNSTAFSLSGTPSPLIISEGTFRLTSNQTVTIANGADFYIPATGRLWANGGTMNIIGGNGIDLLLSGILEITNGTVNVGTAANNNSIEYSATEVPTINISGGTLNVQSQIRRQTTSSQGALTYIQSGTGVVNVGIGTAPSTTRGVFEILNPGSVFNISGGTLRIARGTGSASFADVFLNPTSNAVDGGTLEIGNGTSSVAVDINTYVPLYNLTVSGSSNIARIETNDLTLKGSLTIGATNVFNANALNVNIAGNFSNANADNSTGTSVGGFQAGGPNQRTTFNGSNANQTISGVTGNLSNFNNLTINNTFTNGSVTLLANSNIRVNGTLTINNNTLADGGNTITATSTVNNNGIHTSTGSGKLLLLGTSGQAIIGNGNGKFGNVELNNSGGAVFGARQEITGTLTFTNGRLIIGTYALILSNSSLTSIVNASSTKFIVTNGQTNDGGVTKTFPGSITAGNFVYPIGVGNMYTPASYTITTGTTGGTIKIVPVNAKHPNANGPGISYINYYWNVTSTVANLTALTHIYQYVLSLQSGTPSEYRDARYLSATWSVGSTAGNPDIASRQITFTNTNLTGDYTTGEPAVFLNPTTYTSIASGNWESDDAVWDIDPPFSNQGPPAGAIVIIEAGHTITVGANSKSTASIDIRGRLHLGSTNGHNFGTVTATGTGARTIQLQSSTFPAGNFNDFVAANAGTIEYNGAMALPSDQTTYNNLLFTGAGIKILGNKNLTINGAFTIMSGTVNNAVNNVNITMESANHDFTNYGNFNGGSGEITIRRDLINSGTNAVFIAGPGGHLNINGNLNNNTSSVFNGGSKTIYIQNNINNTTNAVFNSQNSTINVSGDVLMSDGTYNGANGVLNISGDLINEDAFSLGSSTLHVGDDFMNNGSTAVFSVGSGAVSIADNLTNQSGAKLSLGNGSISLTGNWNTLGSTFEAGTGTVNFINTQAKTIAGEISFYNLNKTSGGSLTLLNNITVANLLSLSGGIIHTGTNFLNLTNSATQPVTGYSIASFIEGSLQMSFPNTAGISRTFPIAKGSNYRPVTIEQSGASNNAIIRTEIINSAPSGTFGGAITSLSTARYYSINLISGAINSPKVQLSFNTNNHDENIAVPGNVRVAKLNNTLAPTWTDEGGAGVFSPADPIGYVLSGTTTITGNESFTLAFVDTPLPVVFQSLSAVVKDDVVDITWKTSYEMKNDYFVVERSSDGIDFEEIAILDVENTPSGSTYKTQDLSPIQGRSYYRIKQVDVDGDSDYSNIVSIDFILAGKDKASLVLYPNPVNGGNSVNLTLADAPKGKVRIDVTDLTGKLHHSEVVEAGNNLNYALNKNLISGIYIVTVKGGSISFSAKLIVR